MKNYLLLIVFVITATISAQIQNPSVTIGKQYNSDTQSWDNSWKTDATYNVAGNLTFQTVYSYIGEQWIETTKTAYEYDDAGDMTQYEAQVVSNGIWVNQELYTMTKNVDGKVEKQLWQNWVNEAWENQQQQDHYYTDGVEEYRELQTYENGSWVNIVKETFTYNEQGLESIREVWQWSTGAYSLSTRTSTTYNASGSMTEELIEIYYPSSWDPFQKLEWTLRADNQVTTWMVSFYESNTGDWVPSSRMNNTFDDQNRRLEAIYEAFSHSAALGKTDGTEDTWTPTWKNEYQYEETTDINDDDELVADFHLANNYPNPFNPTTNISFTLPRASRVLLTVHNIAGETLAVITDDNLSAGKYTEIFNAAGFASGMYFYKLETSSFIEVKKMMLLK